LKKETIEKKISQVAYILEITVAILVAVGIVIGLIDIIKYFPPLLSAPVAETYTVFQSFLGYALLLIVGVELILMILYHSTKSLLELLLFVIARKMLVYSHNMSELVFGTVAIALVFVIMKFLVPNKGEDIVLRESPSYSASTDVRDIFSESQWDIFEGRDLTVGDIVSMLAEKEEASIKEGSEFFYEDLKFKVVKTSSAGEIEEVKITSKENDYKK